MIHSSRFSAAQTSEPHVSPALTWAEKNLGELARFTAASIDGGGDDHVHLAATFGLLKARMEIRNTIRTCERLRREVPR